MRKSSRSFPAVVAILIGGLTLMSSRKALAQTATFFPAASARGISPDTSLRITFSKAPMLGSSGKIQIMDASDNSVVETIDLSTAPSNVSPPGPTRLPPERGAPTKSRIIGGLNNYNYYPVIVAGNEAQIFPAPGAVAYGKSYYVKIEPGFFKVGDDSFAGTSGPTSWSFSTIATGPAAGLTKLTVARDGSGDFATLQGAIDSIPEGNTTPVTILLRKGTYTEMVYVSNKHAITILGEDRKQTVLEYATNDRFNGSAGGGGYRRGVFRANRCNDLVLTNLTIRNTTPQGGTQAEAIIFNGTTTARAIVTNVDLYSFQDTLQINGQAYVSNCYIEGDVDFMWGNGPCFFENCVARTVRPNAYYTQIRNPGTNHGYVYYKCVFEGAPGITGNVLSRIAPDRFPASEVVLIDCVVTEAVSPIAWKLDVSNIAPNVHFWEFNSHSADNKPVDVSQRLNISRQLKQPDDAEAIANYSDPAFVLGGGWNPRAVVIPKAP